MLRLRKSYFAKVGWGLTYVKKTREEQDLLAGCAMIKQHVTMMSQPESVL